MRGRSYASQSWTSFEKGVHSFVDEGFVSDKTFTFKAALQNEDDGVTIKETIVQKTEGLSGAGEISVWLAADANRTFSAKLGTTSNLQLQFDNGARPLKRISQNIYGGFEVNRGFTENFGRIGLELFKTGSWSIDNRLNYYFSRSNLALDTKGKFSWGNWNLNALVSMELTNMPKLTQTSLLLRWSPTLQNTFFLRMEKKSQTPTRGINEGLAIGWNTAASDTQTVGVEARLNLGAAWWKNLSRNIESVWLASQWRLGETKVKARVNTDLSHAVTVTNQLGKHGQYSLGVQVSEVGSKNRFKFGTQIDLNL